MVKVNNKNCRTTPDVVVASLLLTLNTIHIFSMVSIDFELVNVCIVLKKKLNLGFSVVKRFGTYWLTILCPRINNITINCIQESPPNIGSNIKRIYKN